jgi:hypothetical protein
MVYLFVINCKNCGTTYCFVQIGKDTEIATYKLASRIGFRFDGFDVVSSPIPVYVMRYEFFRAVKI